MSVSLLATSKVIGVVNEKHRRFIFVLDKRSRKGLFLHLVSRTLLFPMTFSSADLLPPAWKAALSPVFLGILAVLIPLYTLPLHRLLLVSYTFKNSSCGLAARIEFLGT